MQAVSRLSDHNRGSLGHPPHCWNSEKILLAQQQEEAWLPVRGTFPTTFTATSTSQSWLQNGCSNICSFTLLFQSHNWFLIDFFRASPGWKNSGGKGERSNKLSLQHGNPSALQGKRAEIKSHALYQTGPKLSQILCWRIPVFASLPSHTDTKYVQ